MVGTFEATSGLLGTLATVWAVPVWSLVLSGGYGEFLRSFYNRGDVVTGTTADIAQHMYGRFGMGVQDEGSILARDQKERFVAALQKRIDEGRERGVRDDAVLDYLYMTERNRFFVGEISRVLSHTIHRFDPLYSVAAANAALAMPGTERNANLLGLDMLRRLDPVLAAMPFDRERYAGLYEERRGSVDRMPLPDVTPVKHGRPASVPQPGPTRWSPPAITPDQTARARKLSMPTRFMANYDIIQRELPDLFAQVGGGEAASAFNMTLIRRVLAAPPSSRVYYRALKNLYGLLSWYVTEPPAPAERSG